MKLATYADGTRDGHLVVVSHDLSTAVYANTQATRLQQLLDDWNFVAPQLHELYITLNHGKARHAFPFDPALCMAPLPRAGHWSWQTLGAETPPPERAAGADAADAALAPSQVDAAGAAAPRAARAGWTRPLLQAGAGDDMRGPRGELALPEGRWPAQVHAGLAVLTGELALQAGPSQALEAIRLLGLYSRWSLAGDPQGQAGGADAQLAPHWAPVLVTPDELGDAWQGGRIDLTLALQWLSAHGKALGTPQQARGSNQRWHCGQLLAWACRVRRLRAGAIVGCDWLSAALPLPADLFDTPGAAAVAPAQRRGAARGADVPAGGPAYAARLELLGRDGQSLFGQIAPSWLLADDADLPSVAQPAGQEAEPAASHVGEGESRIDPGTDQTNSSQGEHGDDSAVGGSPDRPASDVDTNASKPAVKRARPPRAPRAGKPPEPEVERTIDPTLDATTDPI